MLLNDWMRSKRAQNCSVQLVWCLAVTDFFNSCWDAANYFVLKIRLPILNLKNSQGTFYQPPAQLWGDLLSDILNKYFYSQRISSKPPERGKERKKIKVVKNKVALTLVRNFIVIREETQRNIKFFSGVRVPERRPHRGASNERRPKGGPKAQGRTRKVS